MLVRASRLKLAKILHTVILIGYFCGAVTWPVGGVIVVIVHAHPTPLIHCYSPFYLKPWLFRTLRGLEFALQQVACYTSQIY